MCKKRHRDVFFAHNGSGPYKCFFCGDDVLAWWDTDDFDGRLKSALVIHHLNGDHDDNHSMNLTASHYGCHTRHHKQMNPLVTKGSKLPKAHKSAISAGLTKWHSLKTDDDKLKHHLATRTGLLGVDKTPLTCECGSGPFRGPQGLSIHKARGVCQLRLS